MLTGSENSVNALHCPLMPPRLIERDEPSTSETALNYAARNVSYERVTNSLSNLSYKGENMALVSK